MNIALNETHDPALNSWVESANTPDTDFPIQNLPFCVFRIKGSNRAFRGGIAIGDQILDLTELDDTLADASTIARNAAALAMTDNLNLLMAAGQPAWSALRLELSRLLRSGSKPLHSALVAQADAEYKLPAAIGDYTDFYTSIHHATSVGKLFRPDNPLLPNYKWVPIGYHGRASTIGVSSQEFQRPLGQTRPTSENGAPVFGPSRRMDYELEVGIFTGPGNKSGTPIDIQNAEAHIFGLCLLNDWSARDFQAWEYQPLGPFLSKNFATTISPWIVTLEALAPYRTSWQRPSSDPQPLPYLDSTELRNAGGFDIELEVQLQTSKMRQESLAPVRISRTNFRHSYWAVAQLVAHHTVNGCALRSGDLLGSGTQSGPEPAEAGSLLELSLGGVQPIGLPNGEQRVFLEDGDSVVMRGCASRDGYRRIGFGTVSGTVLPARQP
ncbi:fumarylacetoacetase [Duganella sp. Dugasp56]|uniref:fumarylacetoacetase n=1 Tax=Duganella sp. Dugasp56 TaxID=3243046 RepID=UPI0039B0A01D